VSRWGSSVDRSALELTDPFFEGSNIVLASGASTVFVSVVDAFSIIYLAYFAGHLAITFRSSKSISPLSAPSTYFSRQVLQASGVFFFCLLRTGSSPEVASSCITPDMGIEGGSHLETQKLS
jgi:hypothetical protein